MDAFIYDGTVLNYLASQDDECRLIQVGSWTRMTGYALAFPLHSKYKNMFDSKILELRENGKELLSFFFCHLGFFFDIFFFRWFGAIKPLLDDWHLQTQRPGKKSFRTFVNCSVHFCISPFAHRIRNLDDTIDTGAFVHEALAKARAKF